MTNLSPYFLLLLFFASGIISMVKGNDHCPLAVVGGGCPDEQKCANEVCRPCYRNIGTITAWCKAPEGGIPFWECICEFDGGAPCNPPAPPKCPGTPARVIYNYNTTGRYRTRGVVISPEQ